MRTPLAILCLLLTACGSPSPGAPVPESSGPKPSGPPALLARLIGEQDQPLAGISLHFFLCRDGGNSNSNRDGWIRSDANGRIRLELLPDELSRDPKYFSLSDLRWEAVEGEYEAEFYLPLDLSPAGFDVGDVLIAPRGSPKRFAKWTDREVRAEYERLGLLQSSRTELFEELLFEMLRRGGSEATDFVEAEFAKRRRPSSQLAFGGRRQPGDLALLTAARRLRGMPDPLSIRLEEGAPLEFSAAEPSSLRLQWCNVDPRESLTLLCPVRFAHRWGFVNLEFVDATGRTLPSPARRPGEYDIMGSYGHPTLLAPGQTESVSVPLERYVSLMKPGEYRLRVRYHDQCLIAEGREYGGLIVSSSPEFVVRIRAP